MQSSRQSNECLVIHTKELVQWMQIVYFIIQINTVYENIYISKIKL